MNAALDLTPRQREIVARLQEKFASGAYALEKTLCPCGARADRTLFTHDRYGLPLQSVICRDCGLIRLDPRLSEGALRAFYQGEYRDLYMGPEYFGMDSHFVGMARRGYYIRELVRRVVPRLALSGARVLEVGCSSGGILVPFLEAGARAVGYDYDPRYLAFGREKRPGLDLRAGGLEDAAGQPDRYDLVILNHVFEHLPDPRGAARVLRGLVKPGGLVYISVPGATNPEYFFSPDKSFRGGLHIAHLHYFSRATLIGTMRDFTPLYADESVRAVFAPLDGGGEARPDAAESARIDSFLSWYEGSAWGRAYRRYFKFKERYQNGILWRMFKLKTFLISGVVLPY